MNQDIRDAICDMGYEGALVFNGPEYDEAIIGVSDDGRVVYDYDKMVQCLQNQDGMEEEEAIDFIEYNTIRALPYLGPAAPIVMHRLNIEAE